MTYSHSTNTGRRLRGGRAKAVAARSQTTTTPACGAAPEALENRRLFATVALTNGIITIDGSGDAEMRAVVSFDRDQRVYRTRVSGAEKQVFKWKDVQGVHVEGSAGDDYIRMGAYVRVPTTAYGRAGNDVMIGGRGKEWFDGGTGDDLLVGRWRGDHLYGGAANDKIRGGRGDDAVEGADGDDTLYGGVGLDEAYGHDGDDHLDGGIGDDVVYAGDGNDTALGGKGDDMIYGGNDSDAQFGGPGSDTLLGGSGLDQLEPGRGHDDKVDENADDPDPHYHNKHNKPATADPVVLRKERRAERKLRRAARIARQKDRGTNAPAVPLAVNPVALRRIPAGWTISRAA
jgi:RTX calcium-binding nonapeptide repeat (4 copies)